MIVFFLIPPSLELTAKTPNRSVEDDALLEHLCRSNFCCSFTGRLLIPSLKLTFSHLKMDGWNTTFLLGWPIFRFEQLVSGSVTQQFISHDNLRCFTIILVVPFEWLTGGKSRNCTPVFSMGFFLGPGPN